MVEQLIGLDAALQEMRDLLTDVVSRRLILLDYSFHEKLIQVDIVLHCVDHNHLKQRPLYEVFPPIQTFNQVKEVKSQCRAGNKILVFLQVSHCTATRRIAVGTKQGSMVMYELRASRVQNIPAHQVSLFHQYPDD